MLNFHLYISLFLAASTYCHVEGGADLRQHRNVIRDRNKLWEHGTVVYQYSSLFDDSQKARIRGAMDEIEQDVSVRGVGCIDFEERQGSYLFRPDFLYIQLATDGECRSDSVGMSGGRQRLYVADSCFTQSGLIPFLLSILGLYHEHRRPDRDLYIQVFEKNVKNDYRPTFQKLAPTDTDLLQFSYDFDSITHYGPYAYAIDPHLPTISSNQSGVSFGNRCSLSLHDVLKVQALYECGNDTSHIVNSRDCKIINYKFDGPKIQLIQQSQEHFYPQWNKTNQQFPYRSGSCRNHSGNYSYTLQNGAVWMSRLTLPPGNFCVSLDFCIASVAQVTGSVIQLSEEKNEPFGRFNFTDGKWFKRNVSYSTDHGWTLWITGHIYWGLDVLAIDNVVVTNGIC